VFEDVALDTSGCGGLRLCPWCWPTALEEICRGAPTLRSKLTNCRSLNTRRGIMLSTTTYAAGAVPLHADVVPLRRGRVPCCRVVLGLCSAPRMCEPHNIQWRL